MRSPPSAVSSIAERQAGDVDQPGGPLDVFFHQVDQIGAAGNQLGAGIGGQQADRIGYVGGAGILEVVHGRPIACWIAATMFG